MVTPVEFNCQHKHFHLRSIVYLFRCYHLPKFDFFNVNGIVKQKYKDIKD